MRRDHPKLTPRFQKIAAESALSPCAGGGWRRPRVFDASADLRRLLELAATGQALGRPSFASRENHGTLALTAHKARPALHATIFFRRRGKMRAKAQRTKSSRCCPFTCDVRKSARRAQKCAQSTVSGTVDRKPASPAYTRIRSTVPDTLESPWDDAVENVRKVSGTAGCHAW